MTPIRLVSCSRALPVLVAWAKSLGDTLDACPIPTPNRFVYFTARPGDYIKVGWTKYPHIRPFECHRAWWRKAGTPVVVIGDAGENVERVVKRAAYRFRQTQAKRPFRISREFFDYASPVLTLVAELRAAADASLRVQDSYVTREWAQAMEAA